MTMTFILTVGLMAAGAPTLTPPESSSQHTNSAVVAPVERPSKTTINKNHLERCIIHWIKLDIKRRSLDNTTNHRQLLLEIGNAGFPHYDYVLINGDLMSSSFGPTINISSSDLKNLFESFYTSNQPARLIDGGNGTYDGDCYFLTTKEGEIVSLDSAYENDKIKRVIEAIRIELDSR